MQNPEEKNPQIPDNMDADDLVALLDSLVTSGSQHINLNIGDTTKVQTVNSTECNPQLGPCAMPNVEFEDDTNGEEKVDGDEDF
ncbi:MAG: hypothetical protein V3G42_02170 [Oscillospiraceae bacterium]